MKISNGQTENDVVVGNNYDKYGSNNFLVRRILNNFANNLYDLINLSGKKELHEIGCGEGKWSIELANEGYTVRACDFSKKVIEYAKSNAIENGVSPDIFTVRSIYELDATDASDLVLCCEVLEHLEHPQKALRALQLVTKEYLIISVPREPIWCYLNLARFKYIKEFGNTPGHIQHWSKKEFVHLVSQYFDIVDVRSPLPWTMILCKRND